MATSIPAAEPRRWRSRRWARRALVVLAAAAGGWIAVSTLFLRSWAEPDRTRPAPVSATMRRVAAQLDEQGVLLTTPVKASLNELVATWLRRPDLQAVYRQSNGLPDVAKMLQWADAGADPSAPDLVDDRGNFHELAGRMGLVPADGNVVWPITWTLRNRRRAMYPSAPLAWRLTQVWNARPDVQKVFTNNGRVEVRAFIFWAASLPGDDQSFTMVSDVQLQLQNLLDGLEAR